MLLINESVILKDVVCAVIQFYSWFNFFILYLSSYITIQKKKANKN